MRTILKSVAYLSIWTSTVSVICKIYISTPLHTHIYRHVHYILIQNKHIYIKPIFTHIERYVHTYIHIHCCVAIRPQRGTFILLHTVASHVRPRKFCARTCPVPLPHYVYIFLTPRLWNRIEICLRAKSNPTPNRASPFRFSEII